MITIIISYPSPSSQVAGDYDEIAQLTAEGYELNCCTLDLYTLLEDTEHQWKYFIMTSSSDVPKVHKHTQMMFVSPL